MGARRPRFLSPAMSRSLAQRTNGFICLYMGDEQNVCCTGYVQTYVWIANNSKCYNSEANKLSTI